jgi:hypothetical protein
MMMMIIKKERKKERKKECKASFSNQNFITYQKFHLTTFTSIYRSKGFTYSMWVCGKKMTHQCGTTKQLSVSTVGAHSANH